MSGITKYHQQYICVKCEIILMRLHACTDYTIVGSFVVCCITDR